MANIKRMNFAEKPFTLTRTVVDSINLNRTLSKLYFYNEVSSFVNFVLTVDKWNFYQNDEKLVEKVKSLLTATFKSETS